MRISSNDIKVEVNYPEQYEWDEEIKSTISKWILNQQIDKYGEENLKMAYDIWLSMMEDEIKNSN